MLGIRKKWIKSVGRDETPAVPCLSGLWIMKSILEGLFLGKYCKEAISDEKGDHLKIAMRLFLWYH